MLYAKLYADCNSLADAHVLLDGTASASSACTVNKNHDEAGSSWVSCSSSITLDSCSGSVFVGLASQASAPAQGAAGLFGVDGVVGVFGILGCVCASQTTTDLCDWLLDGDASVFAELIVT